MNQSSTIPHTHLTLYGRYGILLLDRNSHGPHLTHYSLITTYFPRIFWSNLALTSPFLIVLFPAVERKAKIKVL